MSLNINKQNYRLADMSIKPDEVVPYPEPDESVEPVEERIDLAELGLVVYTREWHGHDKMVEQYAIMLNVTPDHPEYSRCKNLKQGLTNFDQVRRVDTWHSTVHSHQYFIDCEDCERQVHEELAGGARKEKSRKIVNATFQKYYNKISQNPFEYLARWQEGKR